MATPSCVNSAVPNRSGFQTELSNLLLAAISIHTKCFSADPLSYKNVLYLPT